MRGLARAMAGIALQIVHLGDLVRRGLEPRAGVERGGRSDPGETADVVHPAEVGLELAEAVVGERSLVRQ